MRVLFIADNRVRVNYGCRATSAALSALISKKHEIVGRITGALTLIIPPLAFINYYYYMTLKI